MGRCVYFDPPKSPLIRGTVDRNLVPPLIRGTVDRNLVPPLNKGDCRSESCPPLSRGGAPVPALFIRGDRDICSIIKNWY